MKKYAIVLSLLLLPGLAMAVTTSWNGGAGAWNVAGNWDTGNVPAGGDDTRIQVGYSDVTLSAAGAAHRLVMDGTSDLTIAAGGALSLGHATSVAPTLIGNTQQGNIIMGGGTLTAINQLYFGVNSGSKGTLTLNSGTVNYTYADANQLRLGHGAGSTGDMIVNGGTFNSTSGHLRVGLGGTGNLTVNGGNVNVGAQMVVAANGGSVGNVTINGGVTTAAGLNFAGAGTETVDINGGQLITTGGFSQTANSTFYIGSGDLVFNGGQTLADVNNAIDTGAGTWIFDDTRHVYDSGSGIVVTSIPEPATLGLMALAGAAIAIRRRLLK